MPDERLDGYAEALLAVAAAQGQSTVIEDELFRIGEALRGNDELLAALSDSRLPIERRQGVVEDLLGDKASAVTTALVSMVVGTGHGGHLPDIVDAMVARGAANRDRVLAKVRSAIELTEDQKTRLAQAIKLSTGTDVEIRVIIDESVLGGLVTEIGDDVIDGSVRHRQSQLRENFG